MDTLAHNMFIEVAAEMGLPALGVFVLFLASCYLGLGRIRKSGSTSEMVKGAAGAMRAGVLGISVAGCFVSEEYQKTMWMGFSMVSCLLLLSSYKIREVECSEADATYSGKVQTAGTTAKMQSSQ